MSNWSSQTMQQKKTKGWKIRREGKGSFHCLQTTFRCRGQAEGSATSVTHSLQSSLKSQRKMTEKTRISTSIEYMNDPDSFSQGPAWIRWWNTPSLSAEEGSRDHLAHSIQSTGASCTAPCPSSSLHCGIPIVSPFNAKISREYGGYWGRRHESCFLHPQVSESKESQFDLIYVSRPRSRVLEFTGKTHSALITTIVTKKADCAGWESRSLFLTPLLKFAS